MDITFEMLLEDGHVKIIDDKLHVSLWFTARGIFQESPEYVTNLLKESFNEEGDILNFKKIDTNYDLFYLIKLTDLLPYCFFADIHKNNSSGLNFMTKLFPNYFTYEVCSEYIRLKNNYIFVNSVLREDYSNNLHKEINKNNKSNSERTVVDNLIKREKLKGQTEVKALFGLIDILTDTQLIEVKEFRGYKSAIGQLIAYSKSYPKHRLRLHLFGDINHDRLKDITALCEEYNIKVTTEPSN